MTDTSLPPEAQRFGRSQTPESPRPLHLPEPSNIPVLLNQMDPVFNDTATYNIPNTQTLSPYSDFNRALNDPADEHDAVQNFLRGAEEENARFESGAQFPVTNGQPAPNDPVVDATALANVATAPLTLYAPPSDLVAEKSLHAHTTHEAKINPTVHDGSVQTGEQSGGGAVLPPSPAENASRPPDTFVNPEAHSSDEGGAGAGGAGGGGVDYQSLLDTISQSASTAPAADPIAAPTTVEPSAEQSTRSLPPIPGLPPKPPPQENAPEFSNYPNYESAQAHHPLSPPLALSQNQPAAQQPISNVTDTNGPQPPTLDLSAHNLLQALPLQPLTNAPGTSGPVSATLSEASQTTRLSHPPPDAARPPESVERPWSPRTQALYDQFLQDERRYVTEGIWDKFPAGSRLFVGNLPSEKVTKRDLFHTFYKHGRLAQISIKQAYGFIQYLDAVACQDALQAEQGVEIRGRKVHLEISKPQKSGRSGGPGTKSSARRRSRSPDRGVTRSSNDRYGARLPFSDFRDEPGRRRDDYRPVRSPSPRSYRSRDEYRSSVVQSPRGLGPDGRTRSPGYGSGFPPAVQPVYDDEAALPLPRREARDVPDVQILILEPQVAQSFINWIEQGFRSKGLRASTIWLNPPGLPLAAVVKRQIIEGVQAIVKLTQSAQYNSKIPLQVFDRTAGASNVNFNEYVDLDVPVAADIVLHARQKERGSMPAAPPTYPGYGNTPGQYGRPPVPQLPPQYTPQMPPQYGQPPPSQYQYPPQSQYRPPVQTPITPSPTAPNLQQLLANLRQPGESHSVPPNPPAQNDRPTDLAGLLSNVAARQQNQAAQYGQGAVQQPQAVPAYGTTPVQPYGGAQPQQNVQNIMEQLARYNR